jgi:hypothetical protein
MSSPQASSLPNTDVDTQKQNVIFETINEQLAALDIDEYFDDCPPSHPQNAPFDDPSAESFSSSDTASLGWITDDYANDSDDDVKTFGTQLRAMSTSPKARDIRRLRRMHTASTRAGRSLSPQAGLVQPNSFSRPRQKMPITRTAHLARRARGMQRTLTQAELVSTRCESLDGSDTQSLKKFADLLQSYGE